MANVAIPALTDAAALTGAEEVHIVQSGNSRRATLLEIVALVDIPDDTAALAALDGRLDIAEATLIAYDTRLDNLEAADTALDGRLDTAEATITGYDTRLDALEAVDTALIANDVAHDTRLDDLEADVASIVTSGGAWQESRVVTIESAITAYDTRLDTIEAQQITDDSRLDAAEVTIASHTSSIATLVTAATSDDSRLDALEPTVAGHTTALSGHTTSIAALVAEDVALDARLDIIETTLVISSYSATTNYNMVNADMDGNHSLRMTNAAANTVTVTAGLTGKGPFMITQNSTGQTTFVPDAGVTIRSADNKLALRVRYSGAILIRVGTNIYELHGDIA